MTRQGSRPACGVLVIGLAAVLLAVGRLPAQTGSASSKGEQGSSNKGEGGGGTEGGEQREELPAPLGPLFDALNPARLHRCLDELLGLDAGDVSDKPRAPELPLAVFFETIRPLGALKYEGQLNYFVSTYTGDAPTLQTGTYEYVFADWNAARFELIAPRGRLDAVGLGYQRTLGVGERHNWAHGVLFLPEFSTTGSGFVGGTALYTIAWKPEEKSPYTVGFSAGANRASFENRPLGGSEGGLGTMQMRLAGMPADAGRPAEREREDRVWRPFFSLNNFYTFTPSFTVGLETDAFVHDRHGEYVVLPLFVWRPTQHFFLQAGAGYYEVSGRSQAIFAVRVNLLDPSPRRSRDAGG